MTSSRLTPFVLAAAALVAVGSRLYAQQPPLERLPRTVLDVSSPSARVGGTPGNMTVRQTACTSRPGVDVRRRIVELAVQEWAFFGFSIAGRSEVEEDVDGGRWARGRRLSPEEAARVASSIAGYWTAAPGAAWILDNQNRIWNGPEGMGSRWRYPWSAVFVSWVMCEAGLGSPDQFQRAVAHHTYIDQAIRARDARTARAAYAAFDPGEAAIAPGDLLCSARRPAYRTLAGRRRQMGQGARTHCDIVVKVDRSGRLLAIGGNVRGTVSLKNLPAVASRASSPSGEQSVGAGARPMFAHLKLRAAGNADDAFDGSPTLRTLGCSRPATVEALSAAFVVSDQRSVRCAD